MRKTELSRSVSRALAMQYPAYTPVDWEPNRKGECLMPLAAVAVAVFAGVEIATIGFAAMEAFQIVTAIGAITAGVGAVTGNQDLMNIGSVLGLAGGIGSFASGTGLFAGSEVAGEFVGVTEADLAMEGYGAAEAVSGQGIINSGQANPDIAEFETPEVKSNEIGDMAKPQVTGQVEPQAQPGQEMAGGADIAKSPVTGFTGVQESDLAMRPVGTETAKTPGGWFDSLKDLASGFKTFSEKNPVIAYSMLQGASNLVGGFFDTMKPAQKDLLEAQAAGTMANAAMTNQQLANIRAPLPMAVTGSPYSGLINSAVTGHI